MTALVFLFSVAFIFGAVLAIEVRESDPASIRRPIGLFAWLTGGNWPAKVGGGLLVVGIGSLLRYALINFDVPPSLKLGTGIAAAGLLGLAATLTRMGSARRAVSLALGGAAFGVAYLTAYSAFALFHYMDNPEGVGLLALTAIGAGVYAITRSALSLALLAMLGAYLAPAFSLDDPGPKVVYGYYAAASLLTLVMVAVRGWRPLIHLSFLFTLAGGVFFAWTSKYYSPDYASVMLPAILVLAAIHVLMPLVEQRGGQSVWAERLDLAYLLAVPAVAALSALIIAPSRIGLSNELLALAVVWAAAATFLWISKREGFALHAVIAVLLVGFGVAARFHDLPWELLALAFAVGAFWLAARRSQSARLHNALAGLVPVLGFLHVVSSLSPIPGSPVFINGRFVERLIGAGLLMLAGYICRTVRQSLDTLLWTVGIGWALIAIGSELVRWDLVSVALVVHGAFILAGMTLAVVTRRSSAIANAIVVVPLGCLLSAGWAATSAPVEVSWAFMFVAPLTLAWLAVRRAGADAETRTGRILAAVLAPLVAGIWALHAGDLAQITVPQFALSAATATALLILVAGYLLPNRSKDWLQTFAEMAAIAFAGVLLISTTMAISRSPWAMLLELLSLLGLTGMAYADHRRSLLPRWLAPAAALGVALVLQTHLLRWLGPPGNLDLGDIVRMRLPTLISLLWAAMGGALTVWARRLASRPVWVAGASLLVAAAVKLVLVDFGSLGQLANILAVIAAGVVFMLVGWLAPLPPPAPARTMPRPQVPPASTSPPASAHSPAHAPPPPATAATSVPPASKWAPPAQPRATNSPPPAAPMQAPPPSPDAAAGTENEYWQRNSRASHNSREETPAEAHSNRKTAWIIAILAALVLPLAQCSRSTLDQIRHGLGFGQRMTMTDVPSGVAMPPKDMGEAAAAREAAAAAADAAAQEVEVSELVLPVPVETECSQWAARLPADYVVYGVGAYKGMALDFTIDDSNSRAGGFDVTVHLPDRNVVLVMGAYEPAIWRVKASTATRVVGVWVSGYYQGQVTGLRGDTPVLRTNHESGNSCPFFYISQEKEQEAAHAVSTVLGHRVDRIVLASNGRASLGNTELTPDYVTGYMKPFDAYRDKSKPLAGDKGIEELLKSGQLRRARQSDYEKWKAVSGGMSAPFVLPSHDSSGEMRRMYVVQEPLLIPADLYGANMVTFIVPQGVARPQGNPGHSQILDMNRPGSLR